MTTEGVPKNTFLTKARYFAALEQFPSKRKKLRESDSKWVNRVVCKSFISKRSQNIPIDNVSIKENILQLVSMSSELQMEVTSMERKVNYIFEMYFFIKIVFVIFQYISLFQ